MTLGSNDTGASPNKIAATFLALSIAMYVLNTAKTGMMSDQAENSPRHAKSAKHNVQ
jgi:hypothetical protein